ncbi:MAG TPA: hypothetical protein VL361_09970 [Candidatus Limnocylindrales bacterium]|nr:hypothetical protein [Candidatus Limnocylindrales bacterium]
MKKIGKKQYRYVDFHFGRRNPREKTYGECMSEVYDLALHALKTAQADGVEFVVFTHGSSTSRRGKCTARSMVRGLMRSPEATPFIIRNRCVQYESEFLAAIRVLEKEEI